MPILNLVEQLRELAGGTDADTFEIRAEGLAVHVRYYGGSSASIEVWIGFDRPAPPLPDGPARRATERSLVAARPLEIQLGLETKTERAAKRDGISREVQTGDAAFDEAVYIDTRAPDEVVLALLRTPEVRAAVRELLEVGFRRVVLDDESGRVVADTSEFSSREPPQDRGRRAVDALGALARHLPRVEASGARPPKKAYERVLFGAFIGWVLVTVAGGIVYGMTWPKRCPAWAHRYSEILAWRGCWASLRFGAILGALVGYAVGRILRAPMRGRSDSHVDRFMVTVVSVLYGIDVGIVLYAQVFGR